jgi:hypothetical protein
MGHNLTHCKNGHEFNKENIYVPPNTNKRSCKICRAAAVKRSYIGNREKVRQRAKERRKTKPDCTPEQRREKNLKYIGWSTELFNKKWEKQGGRCEICSAELNMEPKQNGARACADHCHKSKEPRGILCTNCNFALGGFKDNPEIIEKAKSYVMRYGKGTA